MGFLNARRMDWRDGLRRRGQIKLHYVLATRAGPLVLYCTGVCPNIRKHPISQGRMPLPHHIIIFSLP